MCQPWAVSRWGFQFTLAKTYLEGEDEDRALQGLDMMKKFAENGNGEAAFIVGVEYSENYLVPHDLDEARKWFRLAVSLGHEPAKAKLAALDGLTTPSEKPVPPEQPDPLTTNDSPAFKCGICGQIVPLKTSDRIDVTGNPQLKAQVLNAQFFNQTCPKCGASGIVPYPCVYIDNDKSLFVDLCSDRETAINDEDTKAPVDMGGWDEQWHLDGGHNVRVAVGGIAELQDMIRTVDAGLDPYVVAVCKKAIRVSEKSKIACPITFLGISGDNGGLDFCYQCVGENEPRRIITPRETYDSFRKQIYDADFEPLHLCEVVDEFSIDDLLKRTASLDPTPSEQFWQLKKTAKSHDPDAMFNLGVVYYNGDGVRQNYFKAFKCFREAAEHGNSDAQRGLAICFQNGQGVTYSEYRAHAWMLMSAEAGNPLGMYEMGTYCRNGACGEEKNIDKAIQWYKKSAEAGNGLAFLTLAKLFEFDDGGKKNLKIAYSCYKAALVYGYNEAKEGVERLSSFESDEAAVQPTPPDYPVSAETDNKLGPAPISLRVTLPRIQPTHATITSASEDNPNALENSQYRKCREYVQYLLHNCNRLGGLESFITSGSDIHESVDFNLLAGEKYLMTAHGITLEESMGVGHSHSIKDGTSSYSYEGNTTRWTEYQYRPICEGELILTTKRIMFFGAQNRIIRLSDIASKETDWSTTIRLSSTKRSKTMKFSGIGLFDFAMRFILLTSRQLQTMLMQQDEERATAFFVDIGLFSEPPPLPSGGDNKNSNPPNPKDTFIGCLILVAIVAILAWIGSCVFG